MDLTFESIILNYDDISLCCPQKVAMFRLPAMPAGYSYKVSNWGPRSPKCGSFCYPYFISFLFFPAQ